MSAQYLFAIKSRCFDCVCDIWSSGLLLSLRRDLQLYGAVVTPRNLFLLSNFVLFITLSCLHLRSAAATRNLKTRKKKDFEVPGSVEQKGVEDHWAAAAATSLVEGRIAEALIAAQCSCSSQCSSEYATVRPWPDAAAFDGDTDVDNAHCSISKSEYDSRLVSIVAVSAEVSVQGLSEFLPTERILLRPIEQRKCADVTEVSSPPPNCHNQLRFPITQKIPCSCDLGSTATLSHSFCAHRNIKLQSHSHDSYITTSACPSEQLNFSLSSDLHPTGGDIKSSSFQAHHRPINPDRRDNSPMYKPKVESMDANKEPSNLDGGLITNCSRRNRRNNAGIAVKGSRFRLRREPSITSQEELNARVESFISKFNQNIRIQRQQSFLSFVQMVNRGS